jgi:hypothetical protein
MATAPRVFAAGPDAAPVPPPVSERNRHLAWLWQFSEDGDPEQVRRQLADNGMGIMMKTHDGTTWQAKWDHHPMGIADAQHVKSAAAYFEAMNVPFHAWCVVSGTDPIAEAQMAADVLLNGNVRSLTFDLEPQEGRNYWQADHKEAKVFGEELRRLAPKARLVVAPDPRPWQVKEVPMPEFASFCDEIAPQTYWDTFHNQANVNMYSRYGVQLEDASGITPELLLNNSRDVFGNYGLPIRPVGAGAAGPEDMGRFVSHAHKLGMESVSVWRYGTTQEGVWSVLRQLAPPTPATPVDSPTVLYQFLRNRSGGGVTSAIAR